MVRNRSSVDTKDTNRSALTRDAAGTDTPGGIGLAGYSVSRTDPTGTDWVCVGYRDDCDWVWVDANAGDDQLHVERGVPERLRGGGAECALRRGSGSGEPGGAMVTDRLGSVRRANIQFKGPLKFSADRMPLKSSAPVGRSNLFTSAIYLNSEVNWQDPANTQGQFDNQAGTYNALGAEANYLGISSMTSGQFMDIIVLHELLHFTSTIGNPDSQKVEQRLWNDCIH